MPEVSTWFHDTQIELSKLDPMLVIIPNETSLRLFERGLDPGLSAMMYYDRFLQDAKLTGQRLLAGLKTDDIRARWTRIH